MHWQLKLVAFDPSPGVINHCLFRRGLKPTVKSRKTSLLQQVSPGGAIAGSELFHRDAHTRQRTCSLFNLYSLKHSSVPERSVADLSIASWEVN